MADGDGTKPIHWAALQRYKEIIEELAKQGADFRDVTKFNHTVLELYHYDLRLRISN